MARRSAKTNSKVDSAIRKASGRIVREALAELPASMKIGELVAEFDRSKYGDQLRELSLTEFIAACGGAPAKRSAARTSQAASAGTTRRKKSFNTRTQAGREAFDLAISEALTKSGTLNAEQLRKKVGGAPDQIRKSMKRLMDAGQVKKTGQKRSTEYHWKG